MKYRDAATLQVVAHCHRIAMKQTIATSPHLCVDYCVRWLILKPQSIASLGLLLPRPATAVIRRCGNIASRCSLPLDYNEAANCNVDASPDYLFDSCVRWLILYSRSITGNRFGVVVHSNLPQCSLLHACEFTCTMMSNQHFG